MEAYQITEFKQQELNTEAQIVEYSDTSDRQVGNPLQSNAPQVPRPFLAFQEDRKHSIYDFLARPRRILDFSWTASDAANTLLLSIDLPNGILSSSMTCSKVNDFTFFKCDSVLEFKINAQRFATGCLLINSEPVPTLSGTTNDMTTLTQKTCYPHVTLDAGSQPSVIFKVPFIYKNPSWDLIADAAEPWARVNVFVLNAYVAATGPAEAAISVFLHAENVSLDLPTPNTLTPFTPHSYKREFGGKAHMNSEASKIASSGTISSTLNTMSSVASTVASIGLGPVSEVAGAAAWIADAGAKVASAFGYSKVPDFQTVSPMTVQTAKNMPNHNGIDNSIVLAFDAKNSLIADQTLFGGESDLMDVNRVCAVPAYIETYAWTSTLTTGSVIATWPVTPGFSAPGTGNTNISTSLLGYVASMHAYWRGSITYKLQVVANSFYSGRLGLAYLPRRTSIASPVSFDDVEAAHQVYCDIKTSDNCVFTVPWAMNKGWLTVRCASRTSTGSGMTYANLTNLDQSQGLLVLYVVNPLVAPDQVAPSIDINLWIWGGPDMTFAIPNYPLYQPVPRAAPPALQNSKSSTSSLKVPPSNSLPGVALRKKHTPTKTVDGGKAHMNMTPMNLNIDPGTRPMEHKMSSAPILPKNYQVASVTTGETITNLRQHTRMFGPVVTDALPITDQCTVDPAYFGWQATGLYNCALWRIARIYAFYAGSVRFKFVPQTLDGVNYPLFQVFTDVRSTAVPVLPGNETLSFSELGFNFFGNIQHTPCLEVATPFYSRNFRGVVTDDEAVLRQFVSFYYTFSATSAPQYTVFTAAGDDFSFGFLKAPPLLQLLP